MYVRVDDQFDGECTAAHTVFEAKPESGGLAWGNLVVRCGGVAINIAVTANPDALREVACHALALRGKIVARRKTAGHERAADIVAEELAAARVAEEIARQDAPEPDGFEEPKDDGDVPHVGTTDNF